jgi:hypothetical protein
MACCPVTAVSPRVRRHAYRYTCFVSSNRLIFHPSRVLTPVLLMPYFVPCTVGLLRDYARNSGLTMGAIVTRALNAFVACVSIAFGALKGPLTVSKWVRDKGGARLFKCHVARPPLFLEIPDHRSVKCRFIRSGVMVPFAFSCT